MAPFAAVEYLLFCEERKLLVHLQLLVAHAARIPTHFLQVSVSSVLIVLLSLILMSHKVLSRLTHVLNFTVFISKCKEHLYSIHVRDKG